MKMNASLKKLCGDQLSNFIARNFNQDMITPVIRKCFNNNGQDVKYISVDEYDKLKNLLNTMIESVDVIKPKNNVTATDLLSSIGYSLVRVKSNKDAKYFKKYFREGEQLCKFNSENVFTSTHVYFIIKNDADKIQPFSEPKRQDEYSTSVMSTKISKDGRNVLQITSRYNHNVPACDNTHNSNFNNIIDGLSEAFNYEFNYKIDTKQNQFEFDNFVCIDGVYVFYNYEINGVKIGDNTLVTDKIINYSKDKYYTYSCYIIDLVTCKILWDTKLFDRVKDGFVDYFNGVVEKIVFVDDIDNIDDGGSDTVCYISKK